MALNYLVVIFEVGIFQKWLEDLMRNDYAIGPRHYRFLGWSNSQLRDHAFYMYAKTAKGEDIPAIRKWMGSFKDIKNVPKMMSRMGQCFTQAQTSIPLKGGEIALEDDVCGGDINPLTNERYVFSDGIGRISYKCAEEVSDAFLLEILLFLLFAGVREVGGGSSSISLSDALPRFQRNVERG